MSSTLTHEKQVALINEFLVNPESFCRNLFKSRLWPKQVEVLNSLRDNKYTAVKSGNTVGKSHIAASAVLWFMMTHRPSKVITTAPCYDDKTEILTVEGWKLFKELSSCDRVAQYESGSIEFVTIQGFVKFRYDGELLGYKSQLYDFLVTPEHRCLFYNTTGKVKEDLVKNIYGRGDIKFPRIFNSPITPSDLSLDFCEFIGFWFAEGCSQYQPKNRRYRVCVTQKVNIDYTEDLLKRNGFKYHKYAKKSYQGSPWQGGYNYDIYDKKLAEYFEQFSKGARNKQLLDFILFFDKQRAERFLKGFIKGDGSVDKNGSIRMATSSKKLADGLQFLCNKVGWISNIGIQKAKNGYGETYYLGAWIKRGKNIVAKKQYWYKQKYDGFVYCVKVPSGFVVVRRNNKIAISGNTFLQVEDILWKEIASLYNRSNYPLGGSLLKTNLTFTDETFAMGISTNEVYRFQGFHSPYMLIIIDEAAGVPPEIWEAIESLHPYRVLAIGNPNEVSGPFYECFRSSLWNKISISCQECVDWQKDNGAIRGLVTQEWIGERKEEWGEKSPEYQIHVAGEFPEQGPDTLINRAHVERARKGLDADNKPLDEEFEDDVTRIIACDVATKHGDNETVIGYRYGHTLKTIKGHKHWLITDTTEKLTSEALARKADCVVVDADGVGEGLSDALFAKRAPVIEFHGGYGQKAMDSQKFRNLRSQFYWIVAKKFEKGFYNLKHLDQYQYEVLKNQLCSIKVKAPDAMGRIQIETKEDMQARGIKSPDFADDFMMGEFGFYMNKVADLKPYAYS